MSGQGRAASQATPLKPAAPRPAATTALPAIVEDVLATPGQPLDRAPRGSSPHDFSRVRIHADAAASESAHALGAAAYSAGPHVVFGRGRYRPGTPAGDHLLAHELGHSLHQTSGATPRPGLAPADALAERRAEQFADAALAGTGQRPPRGFHDWGQPWQVHAQTVHKAGTSAFKDDRVGLDPGVYGPPVGRVEVRTGEEVEVSPGVIESNEIAIQFTGSTGGLAADSKWLQFVWFEMSVVTPTGPGTVSGDMPTSSGLIPFTTTLASPIWAVDSTPPDPFYESVALAIRTSGATTIFDRPGSASVAPSAQAILKSGLAPTSVTFTAHFETYLVQRGLAIYCVPWSAGTTFTLSGTTPVTTGVVYSLGKPGNVSGLPANLKTLLDAGYPAAKTTIK